MEEKAASFPHPPGHVTRMRSLVPLGAVAAALFALLASLPLAASGAAWSAPAEWARLPSAVPGAQEVRFLVGLKLRNVDALERSFWAAAEPDSPLYGAFWSKAQVDALTRPSESAASAVRDWLSTFATSVRGTEAGEWFEVRASVAAAGRALGTEFAFFRHEETGAEVLRAHGAQPRSPPLPRWRRFPPLTRAPARQGTLWRRTTWPTSSMSSTGSPSLWTRGRALAPPRRTDAARRALCPPRGRRPVLRARCSRQRPQRRSCPS